jgi:hypothetical protein
MLKVSSQIFKIMCLYRPRGLLDPNNTRAKRIPLYLISSFTMSMFCHLPDCSLRVPHCDSETLHLAILANFVDIVFMVNILLNCTLKPWGSIGAFYSVERMGREFAPFS